MTSKSKNPFLAATGRQVVLLIGFSVVGLCLCITCIVLFLMLASLPGTEGAVNLLNEFSVVIFLAIALGIPTAGILLLSLRNRNLNEHFMPLGLQERKSPLLWRNWEGNISDRRVTVSVMGASTYRFIVHTPVNAHFGIETRTGFSKTLGGMLKHTPVELGYPELGGVLAWSPDKQWVRSLLDDQPVRDALARLLSTAYSTEMRSINSSLDGIHLLIFFSRPAELNTENLQKWLGDLLIITAAAEALPPAAEPIT